MQHNRSDYQGGTITCAACGKVVQVSPSELTYRRFCSPECRRSVPFKIQKSQEQRFWEKVTKAADCWLWTASLTSNGYGQLSNRNGRPPLIASRLSWQIHNGPIPEGLHVLHHCDTPACVNPAHLFLGSAAINAADKVSKGRARGGSLKGEFNPQSKLTAAQVLAIHADPRPAWIVAKEYSVSKTAIKDVRSGKTWKGSATRSPAGASGSTYGAPT
jgi:HNH endonuclease